MRIIIESSPRGNPLAEILTPSLFEYVNGITFPWPLDAKLDGSEVGHVFFGDQSTAAEDWSFQPVKDALVALSKLGLSEIHLEDVTALLPARSEPDFYHHATGLILILDQGPRYNCEGVNKRYIYEYFDVISRMLVGWLLDLEEDENPFNLVSWARVGITKDHAAARICMIIAPLVHSEGLSDMDLHLDIEHGVRLKLEKMSGLTDPHRATFQRDLKDTHLAVGKLLKEGPLQWKGMPIEVFVWWIFRYFTGHVGILETFGRSPWRNVAVGREDTEEEKVWLRELGEEFSEEDEIVRKGVMDDVTRGRWRELQL